MVFDVALSLKEHCSYELQHWSWQSTKQSSFARPSPASSKEAMIMSQHSNARGREVHKRVTNLAVDNWICNCLRNVKSSYPFLFHLWNLVDLVVQDFFHSCKSMACCFYLLHKMVHQKRTLTREQEQLK